MWYFEQVYVHIFANLGEMVIFFKRYKPPKLTQEEICNLISPVFTKEIGFIIKNLFLKKIPCLGSFTGEF